MNDPITMPAFVLWVVISAPFLLAIGLCAGVTSEEKRGKDTGLGDACAFFLLTLGAVCAIMLLGGIGAGFYYGVKS